MKKLTYLFLFFFSTLSLYGQSKVVFERESKSDMRKKIERLLDSSNVNYFRGDYIKSLKFNVEILNEALNFNNPKYIHTGYRFLGYDYLVLNDTLLARESFEKSEKYAKLSKNDTAIAQTKMDLANLYSSAYSDYSKATVYHNESIRLFKKISDSASLAKAHYNALLTAIGAEQIDLAFYHLEKCETYRKFHTEAFKLGLDSQWGTVLRVKEEYEKADAYFLSVIERAAKNDYPIELAVAYREYSESLFEQEKFHSSWEMRKRYEELLVKNQTQLQNSESESVSAQFQLDEYKKSIAAAETQNRLQADIVKSKDRFNNILVAVSLVGLLMFLGLLYAFRQRKELVSRLKERNKQYLEAKFKSEHLAKAKSKFFSTVSHELRTPLYGVIGLSTILLEDETLRSHRKDLKSLKFSADYLLALINDVLQINKIDSNSLDNDVSSFNIRELIESITSSFEYMRLQNKNDLQIDVSHDVPEFVLGNSVRLSQVLMNLIGNACKFTENGSICISAQVVDGTSEKVSIEFSVEDSGMGIAPEKQKTIFDEFAQVESLDYSYQGTGLGLPIVKKLLKLSNSEIDLKSEPGIGSTFTFDLDFKISEKSENESAALLDTSLLKGKKILIVEDNRINQIVTQKILEKNELICSIANNGQEAIDMARADNFDLILMDLNMPVKNGLEATVAIRKFNKETPIVALTAVEVKEVRNDIREAGMNDIVVKPYDVRKFISTMLKHIGSDSSVSNKKAV